MNETSLDHESGEPEETTDTRASISPKPRASRAKSRTSKPPSVTISTADESTAKSSRKSLAPKAPRASLSPKPPRKSLAPKPPRTSLAPKPPRASLAPKAPRTSLSPKPPRKSLAPKPPRTSVAPKPRSGAKTIAYAPGENPAMRVAAAAAAGFQRNEDDISIPPTAGDLEEHEHFFAEGAVLARSESAPRIAAGRAHSDDVAQRPLAPVPPERRRLLANVVKGAVAISGVLCLAALVRVGVGHRAHAATSTSAAAQVVSTAPVAKVTEAAPVAVDPSPAPPAESETTAPLKAASEEREDARHALEVGKIQDAIDAAQRSLTVDPTDAEAWLILGAAQLDQGHGAEAHDAFLQCTKQAKTGNVGECGAMLRWNGPPR